MKAHVCLFYFAAGSPAARRSYWSAIDSEIIRWADSFCAEKWSCALICSPNVFLHECLMTDADGVSLASVWIPAHVCLTHRARHCLINRSSLCYIALWWYNHVNILQFFFHDIDLFMGFIRENVSFYFKTICRVTCSVMLRTEMAIERQTFRAPCFNTAFYLFYSKLTANIFDT